MKPFNIETDVTLECPRCGQYKTVPRTICAELPAEVRLIESLCPECDDGDRRSETWFSARHRRLRLFQRASDRKTAGVDHG